MRWQFVLGAGVSSRLIAWYGQGYGGWSHVDAILPDGSCLGARSDVITPPGGKKPIPAGVQIRPPGYEKWRRRAVIELVATDAQNAIWEDFLRAQINCPYDKGDILGFILGRELSTKGQWICSALELAAMETAGVLHKLHVTPQQCPPNMLFSIIDAIGGTVQSEKH